MKRRDFLKTILAAATVLPFAGKAFGFDLGSVARVNDVYPVTRWLYVIACEKPKGSTSLQISQTKDLIEYEAYDVSGPAWVKTGTFYVVCKPSTVAAMIVITDDGYVKPGAMIWPK